MPQSPVTCSSTRRRRTVTPRFLNRGLRAHFRQARLQIGIGDRSERGSRGGRSAKRLQTDLGIIAVDLQVLLDQDVEGVELFVRQFPLADENSPERRCLGE